MGWHDGTIHGLCVQPGASEDSLPRLLLDIDYIVRWVHPVAPHRHFSFWTAPSTLVFDDVWDIEGDLDFTGMAPQRTQRLVLSHSERGGISFAEIAFT